MFKDKYQHGQNVQLLNIQEKETIKKWMVSGSIKKAYDRSVKGYVYITDANSKLQLPQDTRRQELCLIQPFLNFQVKVLDKKQFHFEIGFTDTDKQKKRLIFYGSQPYAYSKDNIVKTSLHARIPSQMILEGVWLNLQFDISNFVENCFENTAFKYIDSINVNGACLVRRVFTSKSQIPDSFPFVIEREFGNEAAQNYEDYVAGKAKSVGDQIVGIKGDLDFVSGVDHMNQVMSFDRLTYFGYLYEEAGLLNAQQQTSPQSRKQKPDMAFGGPAMPHTELKEIKDKLVSKYHVSPSKIRKAGLEEMIKLEQEQSQSSNIRSLSKKSGENLVQAYRNQQKLINIVQSEQKLEGIQGRAVGSREGSERFNSKSETNDKYARGNKSAAPYRASNEVESNLEMSRLSGEKHTTDEPVRPRFDKNRSQLVKKGNKIVIKAKEKTINSHHEKMLALKMQSRLSQGSTSLDSESNIDVAIPTQLAPLSNKKQRYKIQKKEFLSVQQNPYESHLQTPQPGAHKLNSLAQRDQRPGMHVVNLRNMKQVQSQAALLNQPGDQLSKNRLTPLKKDPQLSHAQRNIPTKNRSQMALPNRVKVLDDRGINQKLMYLQSQKQMIGELVQKYGLQDSNKDHKFTYLTEQNPNAQARNAQQRALDYEMDHNQKKERLLEYHKQVNERRKQISVKAEQKRLKESRELEDHSFSEKTEPIRPQDPLNPMPLQNNQNTSMMRSPKSLEKAVTPTILSKAKRMSKPKQVSSIQGVDTQVEKVQSRQEIQQIKAEESEEDPECWGRVNQIWQENQLMKEDSLRMTQAIPYVQEYMRQLGIDVATSTDKDMQRVFDEIDEDGNGTIEREEMYNHLKRSKKLEIAAQTPTMKAKFDAKTKLDQQLWDRIQQDLKAQEQISPQEAKQYLMTYFQENADAETSTKVMNEIAEELDALQDSGLTPKAIYEYIRKGRRQCGLEDKEIQKALAQALEQASEVVIETKERNQGEEEQSQEDALHR